MIYLNNFLFKK